MVGWHEFIGQWNGESLMSVAPVKIIVVIQMRWGDDVCSLWYGFQDRGDHRSRGQLGGRQYTSYMWGIGDIYIYI